MKNLYKWFRNCIFSIAAFLVLSPFIDLSIQVLDYRFRKDLVENSLKYSSKDEVVLDMDKEKRKLGLENVAIDFETDLFTPCGSVRDKVDGRYLMRMNPDHLSRGYCYMNYFTFID